MSDDLRREETQAPLWWRDSAIKHAEADRACGREWLCSCGPCQVARAAGFVPPKPKSFGWGWPGRSKKAHVFHGGTALCGRWLFMGPTDPIRAPGPGEAFERGPDDCAACVKKLNAHFAKVKP